MECKLTNEQIKKILLDERSQKDIAKDYGISQGRVSRIKRGFNPEIFVNK